VTRHEYTLVDVFTDRRFGGNQLAVFRDGRGIPDAMMQSIAKELQIAETAFVLPKETDGDHRVRIFTPGKELPFAATRRSARPGCSAEGVTAVFGSSSESGPSS